MVASDSMSCSYSLREMTHRVETCCAALPRVS
jgi:hypothetical protein